MVQRMVSQGIFITKIRITLSVGKIIEGIQMRRKTGTEVMGLRVKHPSEIIDWHNLYVIITTNLYSEEVYEQLEDYGLTYKEDFILYTDLDF